MGAQERIRHCQSPRSWPAAPDEITFSSLSVIEACPRQWALHAADYGDLWEGKGYPPKIVLKGLTGTIAHSVVETLTRELVAAGCEGIGDPQAIGVMRSLGGYTNLITRSIEVTATRCNHNPRASRIQQQLERSLHAKLPEMRMQIQGLLSRVRFAKSQSFSGHRSGRPKQRGPLRSGVYPEIVLRAPSIRWRGKVDLLEIAETECEIVEFKTGERRDSHSRQVMAYAVLWRFDQELNPLGRRATKLTLAYTAGYEEVPAPSEEGLSSLASELAERGSRARKSIGAQPPPAQPSQDVCRLCGVRQLCDVYWRDDTQKSMQSGLEPSGPIDLQATITGRHGATSWDASIAVGGKLAKGTTVVIRSSSDLELSSGRQVRLLDVWASDDSEGSPGVKVVRFSVQSEVYELG